MELSVEKPENIMKLYDENTGLWRFLKTDKGASKSLEIIEKTLYRLGLSKNEMKIYIYVARRGEHKASEISEALSLYRTETYRILRDLEKKGLISSVFEKPLKFISSTYFFWMRFSTNIPDAFIKGYHRSTYFHDTGGPPENFP